MRKTLLFSFLIVIFSDCRHKDDAQNERIVAMNPLSSQDPKVTLSPDDRFGELFDSVMVNNVFEDSKTFLDLIPATPTDQVIAYFKDARKKTDFNWQTFINQAFIVPKDKGRTFQSNPELSIEDHINSLWSVLERPADSATLGSILPIPKPYIAAGRNRELTYGDAYFIMLGLQAAGKVDMIENMVENFAYMINTEGYIPNGNRTYMAHRSNPPYFACMVQLLAEEKGKEVLAKYLPQMLKEHEFWMAGAQTPAPKDLFIHHHVVQVDRNTLNRYYSSQEKPRPESYQLDKNIVRTSIRPPSETYKHIRAAAESNWNFSSRWFDDGQTVNTINTSEIIPIDLNALLYNLEMTIAKAKIIEKKYDEATEWEKKASRRREALMRYCWAQSKGMFFDFNIQKYKQTGVVSAAIAFPLFFKMLSKRDADRLVLNIQQNLLFDGGIAATNFESGQSWDAPFGFAPLQWITIKGLRNYGHEELAEDIKNRWIALNTKVYKSTGKMLEKYNVRDLNDETGGGSYPYQDGYGWTNGVLLKLLSEKRTGY
ncbi:MAG: trehalase [Saprospiraceae bacterium]|nr:trehalase [Saprospiraceae bacterium]